MAKKRQSRGKAMKPWVFRTVIGGALTIILGGAVSIPTSWVQRVNANNKDHEARLIKLETIIPEMRDDVKEIKDDVKELRKRR